MWHPLHCRPATQKRQCCEQARGSYDMATRSGRDLDGQKASSVLFANEKNMLCYTWRNKSIWHWNDVYKQIIYIKYIPTYVRSIMLSWRRDCCLFSPSLAFTHVDWSWLRVCVLIKWTGERNVGIDPEGCQLQASGDMGICKPCQWSSLFALPVWIFATTRFSHGFFGSLTTNKCHKIMLICSALHLPEVLVWFVPGACDKLNRSLWNCIKNHKKWIELTWYWILWHQRSKNHIEVLLGSYLYVKQCMNLLLLKPAMPQAVAQGTRNSAWRPRPVKVENTLTSSCFIHTIIFYTCKVAWHSLGTSILIMQ